MLKSPSKILPRFTEDSEATLRLGNVAQVPANPRFNVENPQYLDDDNEAATPPPERLHADANRNYAILWAGQPDVKDKTDV